MAILRNRSQSGFTVITNNIFTDKRLPINARGLLCTMLALPDNWEFSEKGLQAILPQNGAASIRTALKVLQETGYLHREQERDEKGRMIGWVWEITNDPSTFEHGKNCENPRLENRNSVKSNSGESHQLKTKAINNESMKEEKRKEDARDDSENRKQDKKKEPKHRHGEFGHVMLTDSEHERLIEDFPNDHRRMIRDLDEYLEQHPKKSYANHSLTMRKWKRRDDEKAQAEGKTPIVTRDPSTQPKWGGLINV